jgi:hypothetical protein
MPKITCYMSLIMASVLAMSGCANFSQDAHEVLIRNPQIGHFDDAVPAMPHAAAQWQYAAMSDFAYEKARERAAVDARREQPDTDANRPQACGPLVHPPIPAGWESWPDFPSPGLEKDMREKGLFLLVMERVTGPREIVVVFEGTNFTELPDWTANLRWFLRFIPGFEDQYTLTARRVAQEFHDQLRTKPDRYQLDPNNDQLRHVSGEPIRIVSTGHSLGGGLAQHFAYTFRQHPSAATGPRVAEVFAFDPSPVTGWSAAENPPRAHNARNLRINRIYEHGEALAYVRLFTSRLTITAEHPAIWEFRYNFDPKANIIRNHSMRSLACGLYLAAHPKPAESAPAPLAKLH